MVVMEILSFAGQVLATQGKECLAVSVSKPQLPQELTQISELMTEFMFI